MPAPTTEPEARARRRPRAHTTTLSPPPPARGSLRWVGRILVGVLAAVIVLVVAALIAVRTPPVRALLRDQVVAALEGATGADIRIGALRGSILHTLTLEDVRVAVDGRTIALLPRIELAYDLVPLLRGIVHVDRIALIRPRVRLVRTGAGWVVPQPEPDDEEAGGDGFDVVVDELEIERGRIAVAVLDTTPPRRLAATALSLDASAQIGETQALRLERLAFVPRGVAVPRVEASGRVAAKDGAVRVSDVEVTTGRSTLRADGSVDPGQAADLEVALAPLAAADVRAVVPDVGLRADVALTAHARGPWDDLDVAAHVTLTPGGEATLAATVAAAEEPVGWDARLDVERLDPGAAVVGLPRATIDAGATAAGAGFDARGLHDYRLRVDDSTVADWEIDHLSLSGAAHDGVHRLRGQVRAPLGEASLRARLAPDALRYRLTADYTLARLDLLAPATWGWAIGSLTAEGHGVATDARHATLDARIASAAVHGLPIGGASLAAALDGERLEIASLAIDSQDLGLDVDGSGSLVLPTPEVDARLRAAVDLEAVGDYLGRALAGDLRLSASATGAPGTLDARADLRVTQPAYDGLSATQARVDADLRDLGGTAASGRIDASAAEVRLGTGTAFETRADVDWTRRAETDRVELTLAATGKDGRRHRVALAAERGDGATTGALEALRLAPPDGPPWTLAAPTAFALDDALRIDGLRLRAGRQEIAAAGRVALADGRSDATLSLDDVALGPLCALWGPQCAGRLSGRLALTGTPAAPVAEAHLAVPALTAEEMRYGTLALDARYADRRLRVDGSLRPPATGAVTIEGTAPVDLAWAGARADLSDAAVSASVDADGLDLALVAALVPDAVTSSAGRLDADLHAAGTRANPRLSGDVRLTDGRLELAATESAYEDIQAHLSADGGRLEIRALRARAGEGRIEAEGWVDLSGPSRAVAIDVRLHEFLAVSRRLVEAALSGTVHVGGTLEEPAITGALAVDRAVVRPSELPATGSTVVRDPTIEVVGRPDPSDEPEDAPIPLAESLTISLTVHVARNAWIRRSDAEIEIGGELRIEKDAGEPPTVVGTIRLLRGWYAFQGRRFTIEQGTITFTGATPPTPLLDVTAVHDAGRYEITVKVSGSAEKPQLELSSEPPLEQADILSVLLFGKPAHELGGGESMALQEKALELAAGYAISGLRGSVMNTLGLQTLDVELPEGEEAGQVTAGRYVAEDVFLSLGQEFGPSTAQVLGIEYYLWESVSVRASTSTSGDSAIDLLWHFWY